MDQKICRGIVVYFRRALILGSLVLAAELASAAPRWQCEMTVGGYAGATELKGFPLLVKISPERISGFQYADCAADGSDISFIDATGAVLPFEIDTWNPGGESLVWVKLPKLVGTGTKFIFRWKDAHPSANDPTAVWGDYAGVWHLGEQTGDNYADSSGHGLTATNTVDESIDGACAAKAGVIGDGRWQPKLAMRIPSYDSQQVGGVFTIGGWYYMDERKGYESFFNRKAAYNSGDGFLSNMQNNDKTLCIAANGSQQKTSGYALTAAVAGRWVYYIVVYNGSTVQIYENGAQRGSNWSVGTSGTVKDNGRELLVGSSSMTGTVDEFRLRKTAVSADWIKAEYDQVTADAFVTAGEGEFFDPAAICVHSSALAYGTVSPDYGSIAEPEAGVEYVLTCTKDDDVLVEDAERMYCTGWKLYDSASDELIKSSADAGEERLICKHTYEQGKGVRLVWQWQLQRRVNVAAVGGTVSGDGWAAAGETVSVSVTPPDGKAFGLWTGDVVSDHRFDNPYTFVMGETPVAMTGSFRQIVYVKPESEGGDDDNSGTSWDDALATIPAALAKCAEPCVMLAEGLYTVTTAVSVTQAATVCGSGKRGSIVKTVAASAVNDDAHRAVFYLADADARLVNLALSGSKTDADLSQGQIGRGIYMTNGFVENCAITNNITPNNWQKQGVGIYMTAGVVRNCLIDDNCSKCSGGLAYNGNGIYMTGGLVESCTITRNVSKTSTSAGSKGGGVYMTAGTLRNCLIAGNAASHPAAAQGSGVYLAGHKTALTLVENCTIVNNNHATSSSCAGLFAADSANITVRNTIVRNNTCSIGELNVSKGAAAVFDRVCTTSEAGSDGVIPGDPVFVDPAGNDWHIGYGACVDVGAKADWMTLAKDLDGVNARILGAAVDIGCYEFVQSGVALSIDYERLSEFYPGEVAFKASASGKTLDAEKCWWTFDGTEPSEDNHAAVGIAVTNTLAPGLYTVWFKTIIDGKAYDIPKEDWFMLNGETVYVNPGNPNPVEPFASWETAAADINEAFKYMVENSTLVVSDGVYTVSSEQVLDRKVTVRSLNGPSVTAFTTRRPFLPSHKDARVEGFTIRDFITWAGGGGMDMKAGTVSNCVFRKCASEQSGGGGVNMTGGTLIDCEIDACYTTYTTSGEQHGSGIYAKGSGCVIERCYVHDCYAGLWYGKLAPCLGAVSLAGGATMRNTVVTGSQSTKCGGVRLSDASVMENCTVVDNSVATAGHAGGVSVEGETASVVNTIVWNNTNTVDQVRRETTGAADRFDTCRTEDPLFKRRGDKWQLRTKSPCLNAGKPLGWMDGAKDFYGNPRIRYGKPDIGAVESLYDPGLLLMVR